MGSLDVTESTITTPIVAKCHLVGPVFYRPKVNLIERLTVSMQI